VNSTWDFGIGKMPGIPGLIPYSYPPLEPWTTEYAYLLVTRIFSLKTLFIGRQCIGGRPGTDVGYTTWIFCRKNTQVITMHI